MTRQDITGVILPFDPHTPSIAAGAGVAEVRRQRPTLFTVARRVQWPRQRSRSAAGSSGYTFAMQEFMRQGVPADWIVFGTSSGGTHAGLVLGQRAFAFKGKVLGISIDEPEEELKSHVSELASQASEKLGERINFTRNDVLATEDYCQAGYGVFGEGEREAIKLFASHEGLLLDPVYTGRAAAGMIDLIRRGFFKKDETVLFWHTGGQPALFADKYSQDIV